MKTPTPNQVRIWYTRNNPREHYTLLYQKTFNQKCHSYNQILWSGTTSLKTVCQYASGGLLIVCSEEPSRTTVLFYSRKIDTIRSTPREEAKIHRASQHTRNSLPRLIENSPPPTIQREMLAIYAILALVQRPPASSSHSPDSTRTVLRNQQHSKKDCGCDARRPWTAVWMGSCRARCSLNGAFLKLRVGAHNQWVWVSYGSWSVSIRDISRDAFGFCCITHNTSGPLRRDRAGKMKTEEDQRRWMKVACRSHHTPAKRLWYLTRALCATSVEDSPGGEHSTEKEIFITPLQLRLQKPPYSRVQNRHQTTTTMKS